MITPHLRKILVTALCVCSAGSMMAEQVVYDFSGDDLNAPPTSGEIAGDSAREQALVIENIDEINFGEPGNRFLQLRKESVDDPIPRCSWVFPPMETGAVSFKVFFPQVEQFPNGLLTVFVMRDNTDQLGVSVTFDPKGVSVEGPGNTQRFAYGFNRDQAYDVTLKIHPEHTFSIEVDGQPLPDDRRFPFLSQLGGLLNRVQFAIAWRDAKDTQVLIDDIRIDQAP